MEISGQTERASNFLSMVCIISKQVLYRKKKIFLTFELIKKLYLFGLQVYRRCFTQDCRSDNDLFKD